MIFSNPPAKARGGQKTRGMFPLSLIALANSLRGGIEIKQASPDLSPDNPDLPSTIYQSDADWLAMTCHQETMQSVIELAKVAKETDKRVVVGGHHITLWGGDRVLGEIPEFDFAIVGEGELPLKMLIEGVRPEQIPGLWWRKNGNPVTNNLPIYVHDWNNQLPMIQGYSAFDYSELWKIHKVIGRTGHQKPFSVMALRGCAYALRSKRRCAFCAMPLAERLRCRSPKYFWDEIVWAVKEYDIDVVWDHSDSLVGSPDWLSEAAVSRPSSTPPIWCYGRVDEIREHTVKSLSKMGIEHIYIGVEAGSNERLKEMKKGITLEQVGAAIQLCRRQGISIQPSFIIGFPGETLESFNDTLSFATRCYEFGADDIVFHEFILRKGLKWFEDIAQQHPEMNRVAINQGELQEILWHRFNPSINRDEAIEQAKKVAALFPRSEFTAWNM